MIKRTGVIKEFGPETLKVTEEVSAAPSFGKHGASRGWKPDIFCLRIDADEYTDGSFSAYYPVFEEYADALTIFFNAFSFREAKDHILRCRDMGIDIQSHAYYHYTYDDYVSNRYNIQKAKEFFLEMGIDTKGFAAPLGRWNAHLMRALEDEGYAYSSDFSYDYMGFPSYPLRDGAPSSVLQIPIFPVAPELFFQDDNNDMEKVTRYFTDAIDELMRWDLPVIIYAHTHPLMPEIPSLLSNICRYAVRENVLTPVSMTGFYNKWNDEIRGASGSGLPAGKNIDPSGKFSGRYVDLSPAEAFKDSIKNMIDFERTTPADELRCGAVKKMLKLFARRIL